MVGARRWALRAGLVLAAGAAGLAMTSGSAQADSGLSGALDHVSHTVKKVTGSSHSSHSSSPASSSRSSGSHAASHAKAGSSSTHRSSAGTVTTHRVSLRSTVVRPLVKPVVSTVRHAAKPVAHPKAQHEQRAHQPAPTKKTARVSKPVAHVSTTVLPVASAHAAPAHPTPPVLRATASGGPVLTVRAGGTADLVLVDLPAVRLATAALPRLDLPRLDLPRLDLPRVDLPGVGVSVDLAGAGVRVDLPVLSVDVPGVGAPTLPVVPRPTLSGRPPTVAPAVVLAAAHAASGPAQAQVVPGLVTPRPGQTLARTAAPVVDAAAHLSSDLGHGLASLPLSGSTGTGAGVAPTGAVSTGGAGAVVFALAVVAGLAGLRAHQARPVRTGFARAVRLPRQPGFAPD